MDIDLELDYSDRISEFLRSKLQEIKSENSQLEESLHYRKELLSHLRQEVAQNNETSVTIGEVWKKTINGKYVIGVEINNENSMILSDLVVILDSSSLSSLTYKSYIIASTDPLKPTSHLSGSGQIIIVFPIPSFTDRLSHMFSGSVSFLTNKKKILLKLPTSIELIPQHATEDSVIVHLYKIIDGNIKDTLALIFSSEKFDFVVVTPKNFTIHLEVDCSLCKINFGSEGKLFLVQNVCPLLDGALLEVIEESREFKGKQTLNIYCKTVEVTMALLHYIHRHMTGVVIIPKSLYQPDLSLNELTDQLKSVFSKMSDLSKLSDDEFMFSMIDLEREADVLVAAINEKRAS